MVQSLTPSFPHSSHGAGSEVLEKGRSKAAKGASTEAMVTGPDDIHVEPKGAARDGSLRTQARDLSRVRSRKDRRASYHALPSEVRA